MKEEIINRIKEINRRLSNPFDEQIDYVEERFKLDKLLELLSLFVNKEDTKDILKDLKQ